MLIIRIQPEILNSYVAVNHVPMTDYPVLLAVGLGYRVVADDIKVWPEGQLQSQIDCPLPVKPDKIVDGRHSWSHGHAAETIGDDGVGDCYHVPKKNDFPVR